MTKKGKSESAQAVPARIETIKTDAIKPNAWNKRRAVTDEFVESIKVNGILQPPVVRPAGKGFEIIAGERRWEAAKRAGLDAIQCKVIEAGNDRARELTLVENIDRENLTPLEEAAEIAELVKLHQGNAVEVAARIGRSRHFVKSRFALSMLDLSIFDNTDIVPELVPVACLELLAKAPRETQKKIVGDAYGGISDYEALRNALVELSRKISGGLFDAGDETLVPEAGSCTACAKRTGADPDLFGNVAGLMKGDHCLDGDCFRKKVHAALGAKEAALRKKHVDLLLVAKAIPYDEREEADLRKVKLVDVPYRSKLATAKKTDEGAAPGFVWCGPGAGSLIWVKPTEGEELPSNARPKTLAEKRAALADRRRVWVAEQARKIVVAEPLHPEFHTWEKLLRIALQFGCQAPDSTGDAKVSTLEGAAKMVCDQTKYYRQAHIGMSADRAEVGDALFLVYGKDALSQVALLEREALQAIPEPKSWAKEPA